MKEKYLKIIIKIRKKTKKKLIIHISLKIPKRFKT